MAKVTFDYAKAKGFISDDEIQIMKKLAEDAKQTLVSKSGAGNDFLGWIDLPVDYDRKNLPESKRRQRRFREIPTCFW